MLTSLETSDPSGLAENQTTEAQSPLPIKLKILTPEDAQLRIEMEKVVDAKINDFFDVGCALLTIKSKKLFLSTHDNFHLYCKERWDYGRSYANKLIGSAERIQLLPEGAVKPRNEFQMRPFLQMKKEEFKKKWLAIVGEVGEKNITSEVVKKSLKLPNKKRKRIMKISDQKKANALLANIRTALEENNVNHAINALTKLETMFKD